MCKKISFYVAACSLDGGVYRCELTDGGVEQKKIISAPSPMWIEYAEGDSLWVLMRCPFEDSVDSGVARYDLESGEQIGDTFSTKGEVACHLSVVDGELYAANYVSGSVWKSPDRVIAHCGQGTHKIRQTSPHVHSVFQSPDNRYIVSCDLGLDKIFVYDRELKPVSVAETPTASGARHLVFSRDGEYAYVISEMGASIHTYKWNDGVLTHISNVSCLPDGMTEGKGSAIRISQDGKRLYVTERATKSIVAFSVDGENLTLVDRVDCHGDEPRDLILVGNESYAICANQFSDNCTIFKVCNDGTLEYLRSLSIKAPLCLLEPR